tara:strand:- start:2061 stop:2417 length:357 start_codon:yes stop_codon:yes gene_type:complete
MTNTMNTPAEALALAYPFTIERYELRKETGGVGRHYGGQGLVREYLFHDPATVTIISERRSLAPWGLQGGSPGQPGRNILVRKSGGREELPARVTLQVENGERIIIETPGGGGWGRIE